MTARTPQRAGIYCRLSYAPDGSEEKVERQEADSRELAARLGWPVSDAHVYRDNSRSAWQRNRKRPGWDRMLAALEAGHIDAIIVYHGDRLIRQPYDLEKLIGITDSRGIRIASVSGTRDLDNPDDRFILRIEAAQACRESDNTSRRMRRAIAARAAKGRPSAGGKRPFGFESDFVTRREPECALLAEAADRLLAGQSMGGVIRWLDTCSQTSQGARWTDATLRHLLLSPRIAGLVEHGGTLYEAVWAPVLAPDAPEEERRARAREQWEDIKALFARNSKEHPYQGQDRKYFLTRVAECYACGAGFRSKPTGGRNRKDSRIYYCPDCKRVGRSVAHLDAYIEGRVLRLLQDKRFAEELHAAADAGRPGVAAEIAALERRRAETEATLEELADHPEADPGILVRSLASFDRKISELRSQLVATSQHQVLARMVGITREEWQATPVDVRATVARILFRIVVYPTTKRGPGFDPSSVEVTRRPLQPA
ncbi:hypothetical protein FZ103_00085 [Streptomonospora sp. PA3]|uniref:recombinase family protein n=1 Tax=Streptomonospora sp. PA3 TaxID=2607326 RepID=UPI0012DFAF39|nr:recombinase family protein [Streptomonospora sp. PA3]MUL39592.1 hypothetical protein [Streptomonospora sp. PA3]